MKLIKKELRLSTSILSPLFTLFGLMALIPGYPIAVGAFFVCMGIYQSVQYAREANDILYSALLPVRKSDVVKAKYLSAILFEMMSFVLFAACTALRLTVLKNAAPYVNNALLAANFTFLTVVLLIFTAFNTVFLGGFFKTAYYHGKPFVFFIVVAFLLVGIGEALWHIPGLDWMGAYGGAALARQLPIFAVGIIVYILGTILALKKSQKRFELIDII